MTSKSIYLIYSHKYNTGYVGRTSNLKHRFREHCGDKRSRVKQFCDSIHVRRVRDTFGPHEIMQCGKDESSYYEGRIYDLIKMYFPNITLINKNKPNRNKQESRDIGEITT